MEEIRTGFRILSNDEQIIKECLRNLMEETMEKIAAGYRFSSTYEQIFNPYLKLLAEIPLRKIPKGYKFDPTDEEAIDYLEKKNLDPDGFSIPFVTDINLLKHEPSELPMLSARLREDEDPFFFYSPEPYGNGSGSKKRTRNGEPCKFKRNTATGAWKPTGKKTVIKGGEKRILVFYLRVPGVKGGRRTDNVIHEYKLSGIPDNKKQFVLLRLTRTPGDNRTFKRNAGPGHLLASNSDNKIADSTYPPTFEESWNGLHRDTSSPDESQLSEDVIYSKGSVEDQSDHHQSYSDCGNHILDRSLFESSNQFCYDLEKSDPSLLPPSVFDQDQPSQHLTSDVGNKIAHDIGLQGVVPAPVEAEMHGGRLDHNYPPALPPPNHQYYKPSNPKRFDNVSKPNYFHFENQIDEDDCFTNLQTIVPLPDINSCNPNGGVDVGNMGNPNTNAAYPRVEEYSPLNFGEY